MHLPDCLVDQNKSYIDHFLGIDRVYPSIFALKFFLGRNPKHQLNEHDLTGQRIIDIGFGDGRDIQLFIDLGMVVYGVEPNIDVVKHTQRKFTKSGANITLRQGTNRNTGYEKESFDYVFSSSSIMYLENKDHFLNENLRHCYNLLKKNGYFLSTFSRSDTHVTKNAQTIDKNRIILKDEFYKQREGQIYHVHHTKKEVFDDLTNAGFSDVVIGEYCVDWFGTEENIFMSVSRKY
jgi:SAM-dependent methyltransferase